MRFNNDFSDLEGNTELLSIVNLNYEQLSVKSKIMFTTNETPRVLCVWTQNELKNIDALQFWHCDLFELSQNVHWNLRENIQSQTPIVYLKISKNEFNFKDSQSREENCLVKNFLVVAYKNGTMSYIETNNYEQKYLTPIPDIKQQAAFKK